jgi:hypothetical protein
MGTTLTAVTSLPLMTSLAWVEVAPHRMIWSASEVARAWVLVMSALASAVWRLEALGDALCELGA